METLVELFGKLELFRPFRIPPPEVARGYPYRPHPNVLPFPEKPEDSLTWGQLTVRLDLRNE